MSEVRELVIRSEDDAFSALQAAMDGAFDKLSVLIKFDGWPIFDLDVEGSRYHSSLPSGVMKGLLEYQTAINRAYASIAYGKTAKGLSDDARREAELVFDVSEGSTETKADLVEPLTKLGEKAIERMTGRQLVVTILGAALLAAGVYLGSHWMDTQASMAADQNKQAALTAVLQQNTQLAQMQVDVSKSAMTMVKGAYDADRLSYGNLYLSRDEIVAINQRSRETLQAHRIDGAFEIQQLKRFDDRWRIVLFREDTGAVQTDLFNGQNAAECIEEIALAFAKHRPVDLMVLGKYKADTIQSATVLGSTHSGLIEPVQPRLARAIEDVNLDDDSPGQGDPGDSEFDLDPRP